MRQAGRTISRLFLEANRRLAGAWGGAPEDHDRTLGLGPAASLAELTGRIPAATLDASFRFLRRLPPPRTLDPGGLALLAQGYPALAGALLSAPSLRAALGVLVGAYPLLNQLCGLRLHLAEGEAELELSSAGEQEGLHELALLLCAGVVRDLAPGVARRFACELARPPHARASVLSDALGGGTARWPAARSTLRLACPDLDAPLPGARPAVFALMAGRVEAELSELSALDSLSATVEQLLRQELRAGRCLAPPAPMQARVAGRLGMSAATLRRHLASEGQSLRALLAGVRTREAMRLLQATTLPVGDVCERVGLSRPGSLTRLFRGALAMTPLQFRERARHGGGEGTGGEETGPRQGGSAPARGPGTPALEVL